MVAFVAGCGGGWEGSYTLNVITLEGKLLEGKNLGGENYWRMQLWRMTLEVITLQSYYVQGSVKGLRAGTDFDFDCPNSILRQFLCAQYHYCENILM